MRWVTKYLITILVTLVIVVSMNVATAHGEDILDLKKLISSNEDTRIDSQDLAFFLATHNFDSTPVGGYVEVQLDENVFRCIPNAEEPGLCRIVSWIV
jgi:hypothetical protein